MKSAIIYAGDKGSTRNMAEYIAQHVEGENSCIDLSLNKKPDLDGFDRYIIGSSVIAGNLHKKMQSFASEHAQVLTSRPLGIFVCCLQYEEGESFLRLGLPDAVFSHARHRACLGGEVIFRNYNVIVRAMLKKILKEKDDVHQLRWGEADTFVAKLNGEGGNEEI